MLETLSNVTIDSAEHPTRVQMAQTNTAIMAQDHKSTTSHQRDTKVDGHQPKALLLSCPVSTGKAGG
jgi:hypothetical protein